MLWQFEEDVPPPIFPAGPETADVKLSRVYSSECCPPDISLFDWTFFPLLNWKAPDNVA